MTTSRARSSMCLAALLSIVWLPTACSSGNSDAPPGAFDSWASGDVEGEVAQSAPYSEQHMGPPPAVAVTSVAPAAAIAATPDPDVPRTGGGAATELRGPASAGEPFSGSRKIIKNATMALEVEDVQLSLGRIQGVAAQSGGYVIETRTDFSDPFRRRAFQQIAVPVDRFESAMQRIREAAGKVLSEEASGVDVSQEFVDVQSQIANLEATQARVRQFLADATTVEEALQVNAELTRIEGELSLLKGRLQYLEQRSQFSTIAVSLQEPEPEPTATPTPSVTPTPSPTPTATPRPPWTPGRTTASALTTLRFALQGLGDIAIWLLFAMIPVLLVVAAPIVLVAYLARRALRRRAGDG